MKIVVLDGYTLNPGDLSWDTMKSLGELIVYHRTKEDEIVQRVGDAEIVLNNKTPMTQETLAQCPNLCYIGMLATGYNVVDVKAARELGITVTNIPTYGTQSVAQFAIALLLEVCHHIGHHSRQVHQGRWETAADWCFWDYPLMELSGKTMGIIGFGRIGQATGRIAKALGMNVIAFDEQANDSGREIGEYVSLDQLLQRSDVISLHCPLLPSTEHIICKENIQKMKNGVIILNNARGPLIHEQDLADALNSGKVYGAGLDVVSTEPILGDNPLLKAPNCYITPHISWAPKESRIRLMDVAVENLKQYLSGNSIHVVN